MNSFQSDKMSEDDAIRATNDDAASCKKFAVQQGYWADPYIQHFVRTAERKAPEINRGYFARVTAIKILLKQFIEITRCKCQVVNVGAGFDTLYWNLKNEGLAPASFIEVDFPDVTMKKCHVIKSKQPLLEVVHSEDGEVQLSKFDLHAADYHLVAADLRNLTEVQKKLEESHFNKNLPTVVIAECVLVYMESAKSAALLQWFSDNIPVCGFINYEQVNMGDRFGQVMIENLRSRHCLLQGVEHCASVDTQSQRFRVTGWQFAETWLMSQVYQYLPQAEVQRIEKLEFLDERELLEQLFEHYCLCWAYKESADKPAQLSKISLSQNIT